MLVNLYRDKTPIAIFTLPVLIALLALPILFQDPIQSHYFLDWQTHFEAMVIEKDWVNYLITVVICGLTAHQLNNVYNRHTFYAKATFLPGLIYVLLLFSINELRFSPNLLSHLFIVFSLGQFLQLRRQEAGKQIIFWGTLFIGVATVFSSLQVGLILLPCLALATFRPFVWREWFMILLGGAIPLLYYLATIFIVKGNLNLKIAERVEQAEIETDLFQATALVATGLLILASIFKYTGHLRSEVIRFKKQSQLVFHLLWMTTAIWGVGYFFFEQNYLSVFVPLAFLISTPLLRSNRNNLMNLIVIIWLIISGANVLL